MIACLECGRRYARVYKACPNCFPPEGDLDRLVIPAARGVEDGWRTFMSELSPAQVDSLEDLLIDLISRPGAVQGAFLYMILGKEGD